MMTDLRNWAAKLDTLYAQVWWRLARAARHPTFAMCPEGCLHQADRA